MIGKAIPTLIVGLVNGLLMLGFIVIWFGIPMRGSLILLALLTIPFILAQIGWGTLISLVSRTQQQAILFVFALAMLEVACSGFMVPLSDMPPFMQGVALFSSVQHYLVIMRGVMLRGAGLSVLWLPGLALVGISLAVSVGAWVRLRLGLDADSLRQRLRERWTAWCAERRARREAKVLCPRKVKKRKLEKEPV
jgi:ABC-2 type transport system permease protein